MTTTEQTADGELDTISYVVRTEEVYIGSGGPQAELHHLGGGDGYEVEWLVYDEDGRLIGRQFQKLGARAEAEAFVRAHAADLYLGDRVDGLELYPPSPDQREMDRQVQAELLRVFPGRV